MDLEIAKLRRSLRRSNFCLLVLTLLIPLCAAMGFRQAPEHINAKSLNIVADDGTPVMELYANKGSGQLVVRSGGSEIASIGPLDPNRRDGIIKVYSSSGDKQSGMFATDEGSFVFVQTSRGIGATLSTAHDDSGVLMTYKNGAETGRIPSGQSK